MKEEWCAIVAWEWHCGLVVQHFRLKRRGPEAYAFVRELWERRMNDIKVDTQRDGVFVIDTHGLEFEKWCSARQVNR